MRRSLQIRSYQYHLLVRLDRECSLWVYFWICVILVILANFTCKCDNALCIYAALSRYQNYLQILSDLAIGFISGLLVYLLTVVCTETRTRIVALPTIEKQARYFHDELYFLFSEFGNIGQIETNEWLDDACKNVIARSKENPYVVKISGYPFFCLLEIARTVQRNTNSLLNNSRVLFYDEIEKILSIKNSNQMDYIEECAECNEIIKDKEQLRNLLAEFQRIYLEVKELKSYFNNITYIPQ